MHWGTLENIVQNWYNSELLHGQNYIQFLQCEFNAVTSYYDNTVNAKVLQGVILCISIDSIS